MKLDTRLRDILALSALCVLFFILGNGVVPLTSPDEVFYAGTAREMAAHHTWFVPYLFDQPQFEKPILTFWLLRFAFAVLGVSSFAARLFPALFATLGVLATYLLVTVAGGSRFKAFLSAVILMSALLYIGLARTVFTDMFFSVFMLLALVSFYWGYVAEGRTRGSAVILFFVFCAAAVLTKGPLGFALPMMAIVLFLALQRNLAFLLSRHMLWGFLLGCLIALPWYLFMLATYGHGFTHEFFYNDHLRRVLEAEHRSVDRWYFYPGGILLSAFPWSVYAAAALVPFVARLRRWRENPFPVFLACWIVVVVGVFQCAHSKLLSYVFPVLPALAVITADFIVDRAGPGRGRTLPVLSILTWLALLAAVPGIGAALSHGFKHTPALSAMAMAVVPPAVTLCLMLFAIVRAQWRLMAGAMAAQVPALLATVFLWDPRVCDSMVNKTVSDYLMTIQGDTTNRVLCAKVVLRGVRYYTGYPVGVFDPGGENFFSPHPVPFVDSFDKMKQFLDTQPVTICVLRLGLPDELGSILGPGYRVDVLRRFERVCVLRVSKETASPPPAGGN